MSEYDLRFLGDVAVRRSGVAVELPSRRSVALLAHLACTDGAVPRGRLAGWIWPDSGEAAARANLRSVVMHLRRALEDVLDVTREHVAVRPQMHDCVDVRRFQVAADAALATTDRPDLLERARRLYAGDLLGGLDVDIPGAFATWLEAERARLRRTAIKVLEALVDHRLDIGEVAEASQDAHDLVLLAPHHEPAQARLVRSQWLAGDRAAALASYEAWAEQLHEDYGAVPSRDLEELVARVRRGVTPQAASAAQAGATTTEDLRGTWPLVAREHEFTVATRIADGTDDAAAVVVIADAGLGKTRLLRAALSALRTTGRPTAWVVGSPALAAVSYAPLAALLPGVATDGDSTVAGWHRAYLSAIRARFPDGVVIGVDDAHHLDDHSASLLRQLAVSGHARLLVGLRPEPVAPADIDLLWKSGWAVRIDLQALTVDQVGELLEGGLGGPVGHLTVRRMADLTGGNPLFVREVAASAFDAGALRRVDGVWRWTGRVSVPPRLVDTIGVRLDHLPDAHRDALAVVAIGAPLPLHVLVSIVGDHVPAALERAGLVTTTDEHADPHVRVSHPLYAEILLDQLDAAGRRHACRQLVAAVEAAGTAHSDIDRLRLATWRLDAGHDPAAHELAQAATLANHAFDHTLAERFARAALAAGADPVAGLELATALRAQKRYQEAADVLTEHHDAVIRTPDAAVVRGLLRQWFSLLNHNLGDGHAALDVLDDAISRQLPPSVDQEARSLRVAALRDVGATRQALAEGRALLAEDLADGDLVHDAVGAIMNPLFDAGREEEAREHVRRGADRARRRAGRRAAHVSLWASLQDLLCLSREGRLVEVVPRLEALHAQVLGGPSDDQRGAVAYLLARCYLDRGSVDEARRLLGDAVQALGATDHWGGAPPFLALAARAHAMAGDERSAQQAFEAATSADRGRHPARFGFELAVARAWTLVAQGDLAGARDVLLGALPRLEERPGNQAQALWLALRLGHEPTFAAERLEALRPVLANPLLERNTRHARAVADGDVSLLERVADEYEADGCWLPAAEALLDAAVGATSSEGASHRRRATALLDRTSGLVASWLDLPSPTVDGGVA